MKTVFFYRDYRCFSGGHLALWRYYNHVDSASGYRAQILFSPETVWDESNPWKTVRAQALKSRSDCRPDMLLLAGTDWELLESAERLAPAVPVVNRIASVLHADPANARYHFLHYPAIRICDSREVHDSCPLAGSMGRYLLSRMALMSGETWNRSLRRCETRMCWWPPTKIQNWESN